MGKFYKDRHSKIKKLYEYRDSKIEKPCEYGYFRVEESYKYRYSTHLEVNKAYNTDRVFKYILK